ncbi:hypothetical protein V1512DRAFT_291726 [Lipomyces arxii]|uniref:uncharacterized protein n=1 Tax=Lipomyces arxii TaxID=56418 RepID=UPI0034CEE767
MDQLVKRLTWLFLPRIASSVLTSAYYKLRKIPPQPGTLDHARVEKYSYVLAVLGYMLYSCFNAYKSIVQAGNFYALLSVPLNFDSATLKRHVRELSRIYHPDKGGHDGVYMLVRKAGDTLSDPVKRFAYDRFGPDAADWTVKTEYEALQKGWASAVPRYIVSFATLELLNLFESSSFGSFWRFVALAVEGIVELHLTTRLNPIFKHYPFTIYEILSLVQQGLILLSIVVAQIGPILFPNAPPMGVFVRQHLEVTKTMLSRYMRLGSALDQEATQRFMSQIQPFMGQSAREEFFQAKLSQHLLDNRVKTSPEVMEAVREVEQEMIQIK